MSLGQLNKLSEHPRFDWMGRIEEGADDDNHFIICDKDNSTYQIFDQDLIQINQFVSQQLQINYFLENGVLLAPAKAANAGGVATSALEMSQNSMRFYYTFEEVEAKLERIMINIFKSCKEASDKYNCSGNYVAGANIAAFEKLAKAMVCQGIV